MTFHSFKPRLGVAGLIATLLATSDPALAACYGRDARGKQTWFELRGGEAVDKRTGLVWQRCSVGLTWNGKDGCMGEIEYLGLDAATAHAKAMDGGWRVPSGPELQSIFDPSCGSPTVDPAVFPDIRPTEEGLGKYWTTSPIGQLDLYWNFDFINAFPDGNSRGIYLAVRLVRQPR